MNRTSFFENPSLLAIDASTEQCSVALLVDGKYTSSECNTPRSHAKVILPMVDELLEAAAINLKDLHALAICIGPGSFTGIRIGVGVAQGLAYGAQLPIYTRPSLDILAFQAANKFPSCEFVVPSLDARMRELYWGVYSIDRGQKCSPKVALEKEIAASKIDDFNQSLPNVINAEENKVIGVGHGWGVEGVCKENLSQFDTAMLPKAAALVEMCKIDLQNNCAKLQAYDSVLEPLYVRNEVAWEKRVRIRTIAPYRTT